MAVTLLTSWSTQTVLVAFVCFEVDSTRFIFVVRLSRMIALISMQYVGCVVVLCIVS